MEAPFRVELKRFILERLGDQSTQNPALVDRLASSCALVACSLFLDHWQTFLPDLVAFMTLSPSHIRKGLTVLERLPEELRKTNKVSHSTKALIQAELLKSEDLIAEIFLSIFQLKEKQSNVASLRALESWVDMEFSLMQYPNLFEYVLSIILQGEDEL